MAKRANAKTVEVNGSHVFLHVSPERNSQAHRRGCHLRTRQPVANKSLRSSEKYFLRTNKSGLGAKTSNIENQTVRVGLN